jgi:hypothetical protein
VEGAAVERHDDVGELAAVEAHERGGEVHTMMASEVTASGMAEDLGKR